MKKDEALKALQIQVSEETIKASMLILKKLFFLSGDISLALLPFSINCENYLHKNQLRGKDFTWVNEFISVSIFSLM